MFKVGDRVFHLGHGRGTVIEVRQAPTSTDNSAIRYFTSPRGREMRGNPHVAALALSVMCGYGPERYPYRVRFDKNGYTDVYGETELSQAAFKDLR